VWGHGRGNVLHCAVQQPVRERPADSVLFCKERERERETGGGWHVRGGDDDRAAAPYKSESENG
jgi:hypothetical protein